MSAGATDRSGPNRRSVLAGAGLALGMATSTPVGAETIDGHAVERDLSRYIDLGSKESGGPGDIACGEWLHGEMVAAGLTVERDAFDTPFFQPELADLSVAGASAQVLPQPIVRETGIHGVAGQLVRISPLVPIAPGSLTGSIALLDLPYDRWSSALAKPIREPTKAAFAAGARAVVVVTNGPTGKAIALNARADAPMFDGPVGVLAPEDARPFLAAAASNATATLRLTGKAGTRATFNLLGTLDRGKRRWLVVSTPRSGWFTCAGERGSGLAVWLAMLRWAPAALPGFDLAFVCNSGHEYEYLGAERKPSDRLPRPENTTLWYHLGANVAARDWQDLTGTLLPLPDADAQRYLVVSPDLVGDARTAFAGLPGLDAPKATGSFTAGELANVIAAGYMRVAGIFGAHRYHHVRQDDARCVDPAQVAAAARASTAFVRAAIGG